MAFTTLVRLQQNCANAAFITAAGRGRNGLLLEQGPFMVGLTR
ncbi:hypothetical protein SNE35_23955 [Paucibacter sp. R3-3]|uniref:Uncharacterized protein n=1 Tax=Roseateles agri TaxID=3098619 RepID=A0ABU5DMP1_9BURK|nr:hypothetical protein [Paucibacter sp. R3-3]